MNCITCQFLYDILPTTTSKIEAWSSVGTLGLTGLMAYYAKKALNTWRDHDKHSSIMRLIENVESYRELVVYIRNKFEIILTDDESNHANNKRIKAAANIQKKWKLNKPLIENFSKLYLLSVATLNSDNQLRQYYSFLNSLFSNMNNNIPYYYFLENSLEELRADIKILTDENAQITKYLNKDFEISEYFYNYSSSLQDLLEDKVESLKNAKDTYDELLKNSREIEEIIFTGLLKENEIDKKFKNAYEKAKDFIMSYNL